MNMEFLPKEPYKRIFYIVLYVILALFCAYLLFEYIFVAILPFFISFFVAYLVQKRAASLERRTGWKKKYCSLFLGIMFMLTTVTAAFLLVSKLWQELYAFAKSVVGMRDDIMEKVMDISEKASDFIVRFFPDSESIDQGIERLLDKGAESLISIVTTYIPSLMGKIFSEVPKILFFLAATFISCVYFCLDFDKICYYAKKIFSKGSFSSLEKLPKASFRALGRYVRAEFIIFLLMSAILTVGFLVAGIEYACLLAVFTAFIDILPLFGSGAVLLPYALYAFVSGDHGLGIALLIIWGAASFIRQIFEPKIMGKNLGVHPIVNLAAVYVGYTFFGVTGIVLLPISVVIVKNLFSEGAV